jgi:hypothetical protein
MPMVMSWWNGGRRHERGVQYIIVGKTYKDNHSRPYIHLGLGLCEVLFLVLHLFGCVMRDECVVLAGRVVQVDPRSDV